VDDHASAAAAVTVAKAALATLRDEDTSNDTETQAFRKEATYEAARCV